MKPIAAAAVKIERDDGAAVIEGPNGVWKVMAGQTVPGVGRVDSIVRWGNRLIVATSRGLISTFDFYPWLTGIKVGPNH